MEAAPKADGSWRCVHHEKDLSVEDQKAACRDHLYHPGMLNAQITGADKDDRRVEYQSACGNTFTDQREVPESIAKFGKVIKSGKAEW